MRSVTPVFRTAAGRLTPYSFGCGYVEQFEAGGVRVVLEMEHSAYQVKAFDHTNMRRVFWHGDRRLTPMRRKFDRAVSMLKRGQALQVDGSWGQNA
jgi:hypothetical protein